jgi:hypothetical protein
VSGDQAHEPPEADKAWARQQAEQAPPLSREQVRRLEHVLAPQQTRKAG